MSTPLECSLCCKSQHEVQKLVAGAGGGHICDQCAEIAVQIMSAENGASLLKRVGQFFKKWTSRGDGVAQLKHRASAT